jgi:hypothetical protein
MEPRHRRWPRWAALALGLAGCADSCGAHTTPGVVGELGNGRFHYACVGPSDPVCERSTTDPEHFPTCIALGGSFELDYELLDPSALETDLLTPVLYIESINKRFFDGTSPFRALREGRAAFVVRESERVLDLLHLDIVAADSMDIVASDPALPTAALEIPTGQTEVLRVFPRSSTCLQLGGSVAIEAQSSVPSVANVSGGHELRIRGQSPGSAEVTVRLGALERTIAVTVVGDPVDPDTGPGSDTSSTTGDDTDSGSTDTGTSTGDTDTDTSTGSSSSSTGDTDGASTGGSTTAGGT